MRKRSGFSLVELLMVIAVVGILATVGGFGVSALLNRARLHEAVVTVEKGVADARRLAKSGDVDVLMSIGEANGSWQLVINGAPVQLPGRVSVTSGPMQTTFRAPFGTSEGAPIAPIELTVPGRTATVQVVGVLARTVVMR